MSNQDPVIQLTEQYKSAIVGSGTKTGTNPTPTASGSTVTVDQSNGATNTVTEIFSETMTQASSGSVSSIIFWSKTNSSPTKLA